MHTHTYTLQQDNYLMSLEYPSAEFAHGQRTTCKQIWQRIYAL
jgi:hypothetical protein